MSYDPTTMVAPLFHDFEWPLSMDGREHPFTASTPVKIMTQEGVGIPVSNSGQSYVNSSGLITAIPTSGFLSSLVPKQTMTKTIVIVVAIIVILIVIARLVRG